MNPPTKFPQRCTGLCPYCGANIRLDHLIGRFMKFECENPDCKMNRSGFPIWDFDSPEYKHDYSDYYGGDD